MARSSTETLPGFGSGDSSRRPPGGVQSVERAFDLLSFIAASGGQATLSQLAASLELPTPTIHRLLKTLVGLGVVRQLPGREYVLGPGLIRLGELASRQLGAVARTQLRKLVDALGESANVVILEGDMVVYADQVPSPHQMRMFTEVGRRAHAHATGAGKAILAQLSSERVQKIVSTVGMPAPTDHSITSLEKLTEELKAIRAQGYSVDEEEQELGVRCFAVAIPGSPVPMAISVSGPTSRMDRQFAERAVPLLNRAAQEISDELAQSSPA